MRAAPRRIREQRPEEGIPHQGTERLAVDALHVHVKAIAKNANSTALAKTRWRGLAAPKAFTAETP